MGRRYYCDYCERSFQDNNHNRKKHLNGVQHHRAKKAWFDRFRDTSAILQDEQAKKPCRKFLVTGSCGFGSNCRFSHMSEEEMERMQMRVEDERSCREDLLYRGSTTVGGVEEWLARRQKRKVSSQRAGSGAGERRHEDDEEGDDDDEDGAADQSESGVFQHLLSFPDLPPSLRPPPAGGWRADTSTQWG